MQPSGWTALTSSTSHCLTSKALFIKAVIIDIGQLQLTADSCLWLISDESQFNKLCPQSYLLSSIFHVERDRRHGIPIFHAARIAKHPQPRHGKLVCPFRKHRPVCHSTLEKGSPVLVGCIWDGVAWQGPHAFEPVEEGCSRQTGAVPCRRDG